LVLLVDNQVQAVEVMSRVALQVEDDLNPLDIANTRYLLISNVEETVEYLSSKVAK
jgi:hypothetical protein